ncbi:MAG: FAD-dependent oxidoreductase [Candidatus Thiodiazotropha sp.]
MHYVVVGAGPAGVTACDTLREQDPQCRITLIGGEPEPPYSRMAIPYLMVEKIAEHGTYLRQNDSHYADRSIDLVDGPVERVDPHSKQVVLANGSALDYDRLLIATGATPIKPPIPGIDLPGVHNCWTMADTRAIVERAKPGSSVVLVGAGFIGCIILEALVMREVNLTVVEKAPRMVARMMDEVASELLKSWCESKGVNVHTDEGVTRIAQHGDALQISLNNGHSLTAGLVITAMGVRANTAFLEGSGIEVDHGIVVNAHFQTNFPDIYAAGDVAQGLDFSTGINQVRLISSSFGQWMGVENGEQAVLLDRQNYRYLRLEFDGEYLVGASSLGHTQHIGVLRGLIRSRVPLGGWKARLMKDPSRLMEAYLGSVVSA